MTGIFRYCPPNPPLLSLKATATAQFSPSYHESLIGVETCSFFSPTPVTHLPRATVVCLLSRISAFALISAESVLQERLASLRGCLASGVSYVPLASSKELACLPVYTLACQRTRFPAFRILFFCAARRHF